MELGIPKWNLKFQNETWNSTSMHVMAKGRCSCNDIIVYFLYNPLVKIDVEFQFPFGNSKMKLGIPKWNLEVQNETWKSQMGLKYFLSAK
jgi:hypothetical protein